MIIINRGAFLGIFIESSLFFFLNKSERLFHKRGGRVYMEPLKVIIMGAAGRDFHNFNVYFRNNLAYRVIAFTAAQIPNIAGRRYPAELSGEHYPDGIPIYPEEELEALIVREGVEDVVFSYSDISYAELMHKASAVLAWGANFKLLGAETTMIRSTLPVVSVCAVRTGCGKSQTTRRVSRLLRELGKRVVVIRHPMPYGDLAKQRVQRFAVLEDMVKHECTIEEMEEYEPHIREGVVVYAGVDYEDILREAEKEAEVILWDGGNNDIPFYHSDVKIVVADPHRAGHEIGYYPGEANLRMADVVVINKVDTAKQEWVEEVMRNIKMVNPGAVVVEAASPISVADPEQIRGRRVLVVEDGPTLTHGGMTYGAGVVAARKFGAKELVDPRSWLKGSIQAAFEHYPHIGPLLPALGYGEEQMKELEEVINQIECDLVIIGTPIDLGRWIKIKHPSLRVRYELQEIGSPNLREVMEKFVEKIK